MLNRKPPLPDIREDLKVLADPRNLSTLALPIMQFCRTMVQTANRETRECTYINPINKLVMNSYLSGSMVLSEVPSIQKLYDHYEIKQGDGQKIFDAVTVSTQQALTGAEGFLSATETLLTAVIDELQAIREKPERDDAPTTQKTSD